MEKSIAQDLDEKAIPQTEAATADPGINTDRTNVEGLGGNAQDPAEVIPADEQVSQESTQTLEPETTEEPAQSEIKVVDQPLSVKDPLSKRQFKFCLNGWAVIVYDVKASRKRFIKLYGIVENPGAAKPIIRPPKDGDIDSMIKGFIFTIEGWAYEVISVRSRKRKFVKRLGIVVEGG